MQNCNKFYSILCKQVNQLTLPNHVSLGQGWRRHGYNLCQWSRSSWLCLLWCHESEKQWRIQGSSYRTILNVYCKLFSFILKHVHTIYPKKIIKEDFALEVYTVQLFQEVGWICLIFWILQKHSFHIPFYISSFVYFFASFLSVGDHSMLYLLYRIPCIW